MISLHDSRMQLCRKYEQAYPLLYPWNDTYREDVPRFFKGGDGWWRNPAAQSSGKALLCCTGDLICEGRLIRANRYGDTVFFHPLFQFARPILKSADFVIGNLETTVSDITPDAGAYHVVAGKYHCNTTESFLDALRYAGFDGVVNANNHDCDSGAMGLMQTNERLDRHGFLRTGTFLPGEEDRAALVNINGIRVGILSYATYFNRQEGNFTPLGQKMLNPFSPERICADVAWAKANGAEYILSYIHWGKEYTHYPTDIQKEQAQALADAGVDYIVGSHSHCLQITDKVTAADGRIVPVVYSMGNFITNESKDLCRHSGILQLYLEKTEAGIQTTNYFVPCFVFDAFETAHYGCVPADPLHNGGFDHPELHRSRKFSQELISHPEPVSGAITVPQICQLWNIPVPEGMEHTAISGICTRAEGITERALYFSLGNENNFQQLCLRRRRPIVMVAEAPCEEHACLVVPDVKQAYQQLIVHLRSRFSAKLIAVAGAEGKTAAKDRIVRALQSSWRVCTHRDWTYIDDYCWLRQHPSHAYCVQELRPGNPFGYEGINPNICVITSHTPDLQQLLDSLADDTLVIYNGKDAALVEVIKPLSRLRTRAYGKAVCDGLRMELAAGAALCVAEVAGIPKAQALAALKQPYPGMEQNVFFLDDVTVLTDYACKTAASAKKAFAHLQLQTGKKIAVVERRFAKYAGAGVTVLPVEDPSSVRAERFETELALEQALTALLEPGCAVLLCGGRHLDLNVTLRRVLGLTDGTVSDLT